MGGNRQPGGAGRRLRRQAREAERRHARGAVSQMAGPAPRAGRVDAHGTPPSGAAREPGLRLGRPRSHGGGTHVVGGRSDAGIPGPGPMTDSASSLAYFWGEDAYGLAEAARRLEKALAERDGQPVDVWRTSGEEDEGASEAGDGSGKRRARILDQVEQRLSTATLFGGGTLVVVRQPASLIRETAARERLIALLPQVGQGNALCFVDLVAAGGKGPAQAGALRDAVAAHSGLVREFPALTRERMEAWVGTRAKELEMTLGPGAAHLLAERIGAFVREGDVDRRRQAELANAELEKLALYRPGGTVTRDDVAE